MMENLIFNLGIRKEFNVYNAKEKIVLTMLPYWTPLIPPQGIGMLKSYLNKYGYNVKNVDFNVIESLNNIYNNYFNVIEKFVPLSKRGNFYNVGHDVLHNHMMAAFNYKEEKRYVELVKNLIYHTFYENISDEQATELNQVIDLFYKELDLHLKDIVENECPDVVGFSIFKGNIPASIYGARFIKKLNSNIRIVMGGGAFADSHALGSPNFDILIKEVEDCVDLVMVSGQGEQLLLKYLQGELENKKVVTLKDLSLEPLCFDKLEIANLEDFNLENYPYIAATGSSSCPNQCSFCNTSKFFGDFKKKNIKQLVSEMSDMYKKYNNQIFFMSDSLLNPIISDLANEFVHSDITLYYDCYFRIDKESADLDNTHLWRRGGLYRTRTGIESGSQKILDLMHKGITVEETKNALYGLATAGIKTTAYIVIGHPEETEEDFQMTLNLVEEMKDYIWQAEANPFYYHYTGQFDSNDWADKRVLLYPEEMRDMLIFDTWTLNIEPLREERYDRMQRFVNHCNKLGIPNPYKAEELHYADLRWKKLHKNAVPSVWEFERTGNYIREAKQIRKQTFATNILMEEEDFAF